MFAPGRAACRSQAPLAGSATKLRIGRLSKRFRLPTLDFKGDALMATKQITDSSFESDVLKADGPVLVDFRSEEHTSELQSLMRISYAVFCLKKKKISRTTTITNNKNKTKNT